MDLTTRYLGLTLAHPVVASASSLSGTLDGVRRLAGGGAAAVVLHSLFEEELAAEADRHAALAEAGNDRFAESLSFFPALHDGEVTPRAYLSLLERAVAAVDVPVIASLNGTTPGGWTSYARALEAAGAAAIELNTYAAPGGVHVSARDVERLVLDAAVAVKGAVAVPVAVKLSPFLSSAGELAAALDGAGVDGLVLFNRFLHPDLDPERLAPVPGIGLSHPSEGRLARTWIALLYGRVRASLAGSTGVASADDVVRYLLAGADVVMTASALLRHGPAHAGALVDGLTAWMRRKGFDDLAALRGMLAVPSEPGEAAAERARYVAALHAANARSYAPW